ncbi:hypothetical protein Hdeb2414_s0013g00414911 [Helianthus debilis subsp. tardiflorus]
MLMSVRFKSNKMTRTRARSRTFAGDRSQPKSRRGPLLPRRYHVILRSTVEVLGTHSFPSGGGASIEEVGAGGGGLKRNYDGDMGSFRVLSNGGLVMVVVQGTGRQLGFHHHKTLGKSSDL